MRTRNNHVSIWLNDLELKQLNRICEQVGVKKDPLIRSLIKRTEVKAKPPEILPELLWELRKIGNNINQIARVANTIRSIDPQDIEQIKEMQLAIWSKVKRL